MNEEDGNVIAYNTGDGVFIEQGNGNGILSNIIHSNSGLGIDLGTNGVTSNDDGDPDTGANGLQNYPILSSVVTNGTDLTIAGSLNSTASTTFTLQFFANTAADPTGYGEGQDFVADTTITTDATGNVSFQFTFFGAMVPVGDLISATATNSSNNTSEFCQAVGVVVPVELMSFSALSENGAVKLTWNTASEDDNLGFHIYRAEGNAAIYAKLTEVLIPGAGTSLISHSYVFIEDNVETGMTYNYRLADVDMRGVETYHGPIQVSVLPSTPMLEYITPNPFSDNTTIQLALPVTGDVNLVIYDTAGNHVRTLINGRIDAGVQHITWDGKTDDGIRVGSGTYLCRLESDSHNASRRLIVLK
jgi:flagellar hook assembly protein FlgD